MSGYEKKRIVGWNECPEIDRQKRLARNRLLAAAAEWLEAKAASLDDTVDYKAAADRLADAGDGLAEAAQQCQDGVTQHSSVALSGRGVT